MLGRNWPGVYVCLATAFLAAAAFAQAQIAIDFEDGSLDDWEIVDEAAGNLGDVGPSTWAIRNSQLGLDGNALYQGSNIWGSAGDTMLMGTFIIYRAQTFIDFVLEMDVAAADNDGMGLVWAYEGTDRHYRVMMINDGWPSPPLDGNSGPMIIAHKRISDDDPWYELLEVGKGGDYQNYPEGPPMRWTLEVSGGNFTFVRDDAPDDGLPGEVTLSGQDDEYEEGYIGIQLYAQQAEFDNITILDTYPVDPNGKMATQWGRLKVVR